MSTLDEEGNQTHSLAAMKARAVEHFRKLFDAGQRSTPIPNLNIEIAKRPSEVENAKLGCLPSENEIRTTLLSMPRGKAPGMDGLTKEIMVFHWNIIKADITKAILHFFGSRRMLRSLNLAILTLIPKKNALERLDDYRPISCLGVTYKIFTKLLASRLMKVLQDILCPNQTTFIKGRRISDAITLAQEFVQSYNCKSTSRRALVAIDLTKAFDTIRWDAIEVSHDLLGIDQTFIQLVMACVKSTSVSTLVEGSPTVIIKQRRGLRQGDPLSPLLFMVVIDYLSRLVHQATTNRKLELYSTGGIPVESHLAFADDVAFFCRASVKSFKAIKDLLEEFSTFSGLEINPQKSFVVFSKHVNDGNALAGILGFQTKELPVRYLGTPLTGSLVD